MGHLEQPQEERHVPDEADGQLNRALGGRHRRHGDILHRPGKRGGTNGQENDDEKDLIHVPEATRPTRSRVGNHAALSRRV